MRPEHAVSGGKRLLLLLTIMLAVSLTIAGISMGMLYSAAFEEGQTRLKEIASSQARIIESVAHFDTIYSPDYPGGSEKAGPGL